ncbi:tyrosine-protein kinase transmembrane receptor Ror isoform X2 [Parasteatoda tepidariorum]|uniref:tyrosine-protein kinase transmembrane receptor Ror isoform X2 n=1 Tax=Parasteatoda tepidariorum TaxID=114398 RepID=UPI0039BC8A6D
MAIRNFEKNQFCIQNPNICGLEAGCQPVGDDGYVCLCYDTLPAGVNNSCDRSKDSTPVSSASYSTTDLLSEGSFGSHQLKDMLKPQGGNELWLRLVLASSFVVFSLLIGAGIFLWRRRRRRRNSLRKSMQQYITNPNYYSTCIKNIEISPENVTLVEEIGEGFFSKVYKGLYNTGSGETVAVAVKTLKEGHEADFDQEVSIMSTFNHQNILQLMGVVIKESYTSPWMVFEFMQYGDLAQLLRSSCRTNPQPAIELNQVDLMSLSEQIASGMCYLSSQHFIHRDLATRNCLVGDQLIVKISDFGLSRDIYTSDYYRVGGSRMLPVRWMSPESITYGKFSLQSDVWSFGVVLWEIFTYAKQPYYGHSNDEVVKLILQGILLSPPENCPPSVCRVMAGCWKTDPRDRLIFPQILDMLSE